jgi:cytochrome c oxidase subunit 1/cytochrome c oxidase subunit I+III
MHTGRIKATVPFLFFAGFVLLFVIGGVSGVMTASLALDWQLTDSYFVVAHLHYVLLGINVFPVVGAVYHWFPKFTGRMMPERLGRWTFWVMFIGFNLAFFPMHWLGLAGMPRRVWTYDAQMGWNTANLVVSLGAVVFASGVLMFVANVVQGLRRGKPAGANPWDGPTLEWSVASPPPLYNFAVIPTVASRHPLWEDRLDEGGDRSQFEEGLALDTGKETLGVSPLDGEPDVILKMPRDSLLPFWLSVALFAAFTCLLLKAHALALIAGLVCLGILLAWFAPHPQTTREEALRRYE